MQTCAGRLLKPCLGRNRPLVTLPCVVPCHVGSRHLAARSSGVCLCTSQRATDPISRRQEIEVELQTAIKSEDYTKAATLKKELDELAGQDPLVALQRQLQKAVSEERYQVLYISSIVVHHLRETQYPSLDSLAAAAHSDPLRLTLLLAFALLLHFASLAMNTLTLSLQYDEIIFYKSCIHAKAPKASMYNRTSCCLSPQPPVACWLCQDAARLRDQLQELETHARSSSSSSTSAPDSDTTQQASPLDDVPTSSDTTTSAITVQVER